MSELADDLTQVDGDAGFGTMTLHGTGAPELDEQTFDAYFQRSSVAVNATSTKGAGTCVDTASIRVNLALGPGTWGGGTIDTELTHTASCPDAATPPYCKSGSTFRLKNVVPPP